MEARTVERVMTQTASEALWGRSFSSADASTSGRSSHITSSRLDDDDAVVLLSDETAASEAAPLVSHNAVKLALCGGVSGALAKTCTAPLARLTILYQVKGLAVAGAAGAGGQQLGVLAALRHIAATEGITALWKGNLITIMHRIPYSATNFFTYESTKRALQGRLHNESARAWAAGAVSGLVACTAAYPLDLLRTRVAAETTPRFSATIAASGGVVAAAAGGSGGSHASFLLRPSHAFPPPAHYPHHRPPHRRVLGALRHILAQQGPQGLYKGLSATLIQVVPGLAFNFCFYDTFKQLALQHQQQHQHQQHRPPLASPVSASSLRCQAEREPQRQQQQHQQGWQQEMEAVDGSCSSSGAGPARGASSPSRCDAAASPSSSPSSSPSPSPLTSAVCACLSGLCTSSLTFPLDVVRRRLQVYERGELGRLRYLDVVRAVYREGGLAAFYRGLGPEFLKVLPGMAIAFTTYEAMKGFTRAA